MIIPSAKKPAKLHSFLLPIIDELNDISRNGIKVTVGDDIIESKIHVLNFSGDIPAISDLIRHRGHTFIRGCRMCDIEGVRGPNGGIYFIGSTLACTRHPITTYEGAAPEVRKIIYHNANAGYCTY
jgi:hypothetical protein